MSAIQDQRSAKMTRLSIWFAINLVIFMICYFNYCFQLKHRYLYKILKAGLCFSRAAAMVINFNLLLVWLPMCKYTLTKLTCLASKISARERDKLQDRMLREGKPDDVIVGKDTATCVPVAVKLAVTNLDNNCVPKCNMQQLPLTSYLKRNIGKALGRLDCLIITFKIKSINSFLVAVDHCTSLHTICATTITLASVIHTVAHIMNVINFSRRFDPFLGNLNMAEYRGQNPLQLLISVPGITGGFMTLILVLMSLSSIHFIRNCSFDLFQIFHKLSILFVILLILHPSSHVLKEQGNTLLHNPDLCHTLGASTNFTDSNNSTLHTASLVSKAERHNVATPTDIYYESNEAWSIESEKNESSSSLFQLSKLKSQTFPTAKNVVSSSSSTDGLNTSKSCIDKRPKFVAQSSYCWFVLSIGLTCYLFDLLLRRLRRSRETVELLEARINQQNDLVELVMSNNHRRFSYWSPGQFVYLNCPQISSYEWHPFTISSMDHANRLFTLHIKAAGDWTKELKNQLEIRSDGHVCASCHSMFVDDPSGNYNTWLRSQQSSSLEKLTRDNSVGNNLKHYVTEQLCTACLAKQTSPAFNPSRCGVSIDSMCKTTKLSFSRAIRSHRFLGIGRMKENKIQCHVADLECVDSRTGQTSITCKKLVRVHDDIVREESSSVDEANITNEGDCYNPCLDNCFAITLPDANIQRSNLNKCPPLELFVDGPFHSPFERLSDQQVSVCISNGVGWTAFSSIFQNYLYPKNESTIERKIENSNYSSNLYNLHRSQFEEILGQKPQRAYSGCNPYMNITNQLHKNLHLMIIVTTIEQFRPFYEIASKHFNRGTPSNYSDSNLDVCRSFATDATNVSPIKELTVFITRSDKDDESVKSFCKEQNLHLPSKSLLTESNVIYVNKEFTILFGRPNIQEYMGKFSQIYHDKRKISVYCCGSHQVKKLVRGLCKQLNHSTNTSSLQNSQLTKLDSLDRGGRRPVYCYHEENF